MRHKLLVTVAAALILVVVIVSALQPPGESPQTPSEDQDRALVPVANEPGGAAPMPVPEPTREAIPAPAVEESPSDPPADPTAGALEIECVWDDGTPAAGVEIVCYPVVNDNLQQDVARPTSGGDGRARVEPLATGTYALTVERARARVEVERGELAKARLELRSRATVRGRVVDGDGVPVPGATIEYAGRSRVPWPVAVSAADGTFEFRVASLGIANARKVGYVPDSRTKVKGGDNEIELRLASGGTSIAGLIVDPERTPVPGAFVVVAGIDSEEADRMPAAVRTGPDGRFAVDGVPVARCIVYAVAPGFATGDAVVETALGRRAETVVQLRRGATVRGVVRGRDGEPVTKQTVQVHRDQNLPGLWRDLGSHFTYRYTLTDAEGRYELSAIPPGTMWITALLQAPKSEIIHLVDEQVKEWNAIDAPNGTLTIRGTLLGVDGERVSGWRISTSFTNLKAAQVERSNATTDAEGRFELKELRDREYDLLLLGPGSAWEPLAMLPKIAAGGPEVTWRMPFGLDDLGTIQGRALGPNGEVVRGLRAVAELENVQRNSNVSSRGTMRFSSLPPGEWTVRISSREWGSFVIGSWNVAPGADVDFGEVRLPVRGRAVARCSVANLLAGLTLQLREIDGRNRATEFTTAADTRISTPVPPGRYELLAFGPGTAPLQVPVEIAAGADTAVTLMPEPAPAVNVTFVAAGLVERRWQGFVTLKVLDGQGAEVARHTEKVDSDGEHKFELALAPGQYTIAGVSHASPRRSGELPVTITAGAAQPFDVRIVLAIE